MGYKYKIGDVVKVKNNLKPDFTLYCMDDNSEALIVMSDMLKHQGKEVTILKYDNGAYKVDDSGYRWTDQMFEKLVKPANSDNWKLIITPNGDTTKAIFIHDGVKDEVTVTRYYKDEYNIQEAVEAVVEKVFTKPIGFKVGDIIEYKGNGCIPDGTRAVIVDIDIDGDLMVDFKFKYPCTHDGFGRFTDKTYYLVFPENCKKVS